MGVSSSKVRKSRGALCKRSVEKPIVYERVLFRQRNESSSVGLAITPTYEKEMMSFAFKKAEWKQERMKLKEEVRVLRALVDEKEEMIRELRHEKRDREKDHNIGVVESVDYGDDDGKKGVLTKWGFLGAHELVLIEQIREERAMRDETIQKWKQLYLAIKMELDDLIQRTHEGGLYWKAEEEDIAEELKKDIKAKEETIKELRTQLASMEKEIFKRDRESDIFRQSLRIMSSTKNPPRKVVANQGGHKL